MGLKPCPSLVDVNPYTRSKCRAKAAYAWRKMKNCGLLSLTKVTAGPEFDASNPLLSKSFVSFTADRYCTAHYCCAPRVKKMNSLRSRRHCCQQKTNIKP